MELMSNTIIEGKFEEIVMVRIHERMMKRK